MLLTDYEIQNWAKTLVDPQGCAVKVCQIVPNYMVLFVRVTRAD